MGSPIRHRRRWVARLLPSPARLIPTRGGRGSFIRDGGERGTALGRADGILMSEKQLGRAVADGKRLLFTFASGRRVEGYLVGWDRYSYLVWEPYTGDDHFGYREHLIHKAGAELVTITDGLLIEEPDQLRAAIAPIRDSFLKSLVNSGAVAAHQIQEGSPS